MAKVTEKLVQANERRREQHLLKRRFKINTYPLALSTESVSLFFRFKSMYYFMICAYFVSCVFFVFLFSKGASVIKSVDTMYLLSRGQREVEAGFFWMRRNCV